MQAKKATSLILVILLVMTLFTGCNKSGDSKEVGPEIGQWHAEIRLSDLSNSMSTEDRMIMTLLTGDLMFEVDVEFCKDGTFSYVLDTDKLEKAISSTLSTAMGFFIDIDVSLFTDRLIEVAMKEALQGTKQAYYGTYIKSDDNYITATDGEQIYFRLIANTLIQMDDEGNDVLTFKKK